MWERLTCRNGHKLKIDRKTADQVTICPKCQARVYLWIRIVCPNGHAIKVKTKHAGKMGTCPDCKSKVVVPDLTEALAMDILETEDAGPPASAGQEPPVDGGSSVGASSTDSPSTDAPSTDAPSTAAANGGLVVTRICPSCEGKIAKSYRTCPICSKYIGEAPENDAEGPTIKSTKCPKCGSTSFPGDTYCANCGEPLRQQYQPH